MCFINSSDADTVCTTTTVLSGRGVHETVSAFLRFEQANREILDGDMMQMIQNNPADVAYTVFSQAFLQGMIRLFQKDNEMKSVVLSDSEAREQATRHFFRRAQRAAREGGWKHVVAK
ncbi:hypothetical protein K3727_18890 [Rhodobacteraceae bacterium M382]|nr:hypothetical protein K3727_18890 [Rhodobacteraceae bacterium M382]